MSWFEIALAVGLVALAALYGIVRQLQPRPPLGRIIVTFGSPVLTNYSRKVAPPMALPNQSPAPPLPAGYQVGASVAGFNSDGSSLAVNPTWSTDNSTVATVVPASDNQSATVFGWSTGSCNLSLRDPATGLSTSIPLSVTPPVVTPPTPAALIVTFGTPSPQPPAAVVPQ